MDVIGLNQRFIRELIEAYKQQPALWKVKSVEYKSKLQKTQAYEILIKKCREFVHDADREFVRMKINSLRTSFRKEYKKVVNSRKSGLGPDELYKPHLWYYDLLMFIVNEQSEDSGASSHIQDVMEHDDDSSGSSYDHAKSEIPMKQEVSLGSPAFQEIYYDPLSDVSSTYERAPKRKAAEEPVRTARSAPRIEDVFDAIGKNVAHKLRGMTTQQRIIAEKIISDVMYHGQMETLTADSRLTVEKCFDLGDAC